MNVASTIVVALKALLRNPTRALLTTLGIVIGIAAVITMMEIGTGSSQSIQSSIEKMGANTILVLPGASRRGGVNQGSGSRMSLTPEDCEAILRECVSVGTAVPVVNAGGYQVISGNVNYAPSRITGTAPDFLTIRNWEVEEGRNFTLRETNSRATVCLVGTTIVREVFGGNSPIDSELRIKDTAFKVIGVLKSKGANMMGSDEDDVIILPWTTTRLRLTGLKTGEASDTTSTAATSPSALYPGEGVAFYPEPDENLETDTLLMPKFIHIDMIQMVATSPEKVDEAIDEVTTLLRERHRIKPGEDDDFHIRNSAEFMQMLTGTTTVMTNLLLGVALISLIVGGVGIMNIMLVSVTERTREIGLRMAVGARSRDILQQFLIESMVLCLVGGVVGILLGHGAALLVERYLGWPIASSPEAVLAAVAVSAAVGLVFGFYPAWKASKLDPIEALRYE
ncbi:ABC transporter permease [uncultured Victivallis sp.]|uniref:ABC transporter permease n=1 Tax=uncultured Victivallis sp. TaxID=354118 RepID=UPI0025E0D9A5|nr:ABC transporter permease [uncultured Victivallis sp.]